MAYYALVTKINNVHKDPNSNNLYLADCFGEGVIIGSDMKEGDLVLYLPQDGKIERWFGDPFKLFRKNKDGTAQGGYIEDSQHIRAIKLRGNESSGIVIKVDRVYEVFGNQNWKDGDKINSINGKDFCCKYIPKRNSRSHSGNKKTSYKGRKAEGITYPEFSMHADTEQLAYNLDKFKPGDIINISAKLHGTSQRSMKTYAELPNGFWRRLFHLKKKKIPTYVLGTRHCVVTEDAQGYYGNNSFRMKHHEKIKDFVDDSVEVFYEVVGWYGPNEANTIMPIGDNTKVNDKNFIKEFGKRSIFSYGCKPGESEMYVYRITSNNGEYEYTPEEIITWCDKAGVHYVPQIDNFTFTTQENLMECINSYLEDLHDPIDPSHIKEGVVVRIVNRRTFTAYKIKSMEFKIIEGIIKETANVPDMEEAQEI